jgi:haloalkane dehalogenase
MQINIDLYPFQSRYCRIGGYRYHYVDEGQGHPVVMLHGNPTWSFYYRSLITGLRDECRALAPDHIGCGLSEKPPGSAYGYSLDDRVRDFDQFLETVGITGDLSLILHDWGGMIGLAWAVQHPDRVKRLVILNTSGFFPPGGKTLPMRLRMIRNLSWFAEPAVLHLNLFARGALWMAAKKSLPPDVKKALLAPYDTPANRIATLRFVQDIPVGPTDPSYDTVRRVDDHLGDLKDIPMLICWGKHDFVFDEDYYNEWRRRFPHAESHLFSDAGHYLLEDAPNRVLDRIRIFFSRFPQ